MKRIISILAAIFALTTLSVSAQIKVEVPPVVEVGEQFRAVFTLSEKPSSFEWAPADGISILWGPQQGSSSSTTWINGKTTSVSQYTYSYILSATAPGKFSIPSAVATVSGRQLRSNPAAIEVVASSSASANNSAAASSSQNAQSSSKNNSQGNPSTYLTLRLNKSSVRQGEPVTATLSLYTNENISGFEDARFPSFNGFWSEETISPTNIQFKRENVNGRIFNSALIRQWTLIPQHSGAMSIEPAELMCLIQQRVSSGDPFFDGFFDDYRTYRKRLTSSELKVDVKPLPSGAPESFTGSVGRYSIEASLSGDSLRMHESALLKVKIKGSGNVSLLTAPKVNFHPDNEVYDVKTTSNVAKGISGEKIFEYPFIPRSYGDFEIPPVEFTYFDPSADRYVTISTKAIPYNVEKVDTPAGYSETNTISIPVAQRKSVENLSSDIRFITTKLPKLTQGVHFFVGSVAFTIIVMLLVLAAILIAALVKFTRSRRADMVGSRIRSASKLAVRRLSRAKSYLAKGQEAPYYEELHKALLGYVADKLNIGGSELSKESIASLLQTRGVDQTVTDSYLDLLNRCEFARYSPEGGEAMMRETYDNAVQVISSMDSKLKKSSASRKGVLSALVIFLAASFSMNAASAGVDSLWNAGVHAYTDKDYAAALDAFRTIYDDGMVSPELMTNIADCNFKSGNLGQAILFYERALKLDPSFEDAKYNLSIANELIQDKIESVPELGIRQLLRKICYAFSSNAWTWMFICLLALALAMGLTYFLSYSRPWKITGFFSAIVALLLSLWCISNARWQKKEAFKCDRAVVTAAVSTVRSAPEVSGSEQFILHEGTTVRIKDTLGEWTRISIADGREGWMPSFNITVI